MLNVFEREIKHLFRNIKAVIVMGIFTLGVGIAFTAAVLSSGYGSVYPVFSVATIIAALTIPAVTSLSIVRERKNGTDWYLAALPFTKGQIIWGKLGANLVFFAIPLASAGLCPFVMGLCGAPKQSAAYIAYLMLVVFCVFVISMCTMISSFFHKPWKSLLTSYLVLVLLFLLGTLSSLFMNSALVGMILFAVLALAVGFLLYFALRSIVIPAIISGIGVILSAALYFIYPSALENSVRDLLYIISPFKQYNSAVLGILDMSSILFFVSCIAFFIWMTHIFFYRKKREKGAPRVALNAKSIISIALVAVMLLGVNIAGVAAPASLTKLDISENKLYNISSGTKNFVSSLSEPIDIYIVNPGFMDEQVKTYVKMYSELSNQITVSEISGFKTAQFLSNYGEESASNSSCGIVVQSQKRWSKISYNDMFYYTNENLGSMSLTEYAYYYSQCQEAQKQSSLSAKESQELQEVLEMLTYDTDLLFRGEQALTYAIEYVTEPHIPALYVLYGHGEKNSTKMAVAITAYLNGAQTEEIKTFDITATNEIPEDMGILVLDCPSSDYTAEEIRKLTEYLNGGGRMLVITNEANHSMPNLMNLLSYYGLSASEGVITKDGSTTVVAKAANTQTESGMKINNASFINSASVDAIGVYNILTVDVVEGDTTQNKPIGVIAYENNYPKLAWITGGNTFSTDVKGTEDDITSLRFINTVRGGMQKTFTLSVSVGADKSYSADILSYSSSASAYAGIFFIAVIPMLAFGIPAIRIYSRKKRSNLKKENI